MRFTRILLLVVLASAFAGALASSASALGFEDEPCPLTDPVDHQLKVCHPDAEVGKPYTLQIKGKGGCTPDFVRYDVISGTLPPGLKVDAGTALVTGTPTQAGVFKFWLQVSDLRQSWCADDKQSQWQFQIRVVQSLQIVQRQSTLTPAAVNSPYSFQFTVNGAQGTPSWSVASGALPAGLSLNSSTGLLSGTPTATGDYHFQIKAVDGTRSDIQTYTLSIVEPLKVTSATSVAGEVGQAFQGSLTVSGGKPGYTWSVGNGTSLPAGLTLNASTGAITGTPTAAGVFPLKLTVTDSLGLSQTVDYRVVIAAQLAIVKRALPAARTGHAYFARLFAHGGVAPRTWRIAGGSLAAGLRLNTHTGVITGTPRRAGRSTVTIEVTDQLGAVSKTTFSLKVVH